MSDASLVLTQTKHMGPMACRAVMKVCADQLAWSIFDKIVPIAL